MHSGHGWIKKREHHDRYSWVGPNAKSVVLEAMVWACVFAPSTVDAMNALATEEGRDSISDIESSHWMQNGECLGRGQCLEKNSWELCPGTEESGHDGYEAEW